MSRMYAKSSTTNAQFIAGGIGVLITVYLGFQLSSFIRNDEIKIRKKNCLYEYATSKCFELKLEEAKLKENYNKKIKELEKNKSQL